MLTGGGMVGQTNGWTGWKGEAYQEALEVPKGYLWKGWKSVWVEGQFAGWKDEETED